MNMHDIPGLLAMIFSLLVGAIFHEMGHAWAAFRLGDMTARDAGRLTLNPLKHIDPITTLLMPVGLYLLGIPPLIMFKPVPINVMNFKNPRTGSRIVSLAGPGTNFLLALAAAILFRVLMIFMHSQASVTALASFAALFIFVNLLLGSFNLIPIPPLDGSWILASFLSPNLARIFNSLRTYLLIAFLFLVFSGLFGNIWTPISRFLQTITNFLMFAKL
jgi:Zn-dependent protease